jgi:hypothetical protein
MVGVLSLAGLCAVNMPRIEIRLSDGGISMASEVARTISTIAIWGTVAAVLMTLKVNGPADMATTIMVGMTAFLSIGAAVGTFAVWRSPRPAGSSSGPSKVPDREV